MSKESPLLHPLPATPASDATAERAAVANAAAASFAALMGKLDYLSDADIEMVRRAYRMADQAHLGQWRKNGEPYITHPIAVAATVAEWKLDAPALAAALLHDTMEDCGVTKADLVEHFGAAVADLVDGLTKLEKLEFDTREQNQAESFRKMLLAMSRDVRVILIKLADRTHNMRTLSDMPRSKWGRIAGETLEIYAPIAHRLGLNQTFRELQDLSFRHLMPWRYEVLAKATARARHRRRELLQTVEREVAAAFASSGLKVDVIAREKTLYSIYRKMDDQHVSFAQLHDVYGLRVILPTVMDCYTGLGVLHQLYKPVPGRFKDYIAIAKANGYQSLHTTLVGPANVNIEFQLRTPAMDVIAESGVAAHWLYKVGQNPSDNTGHLGMKWMQSLLEIQSATGDASEFLENVKVDLFPDSLYVFTPKGRILSLPRGATVVDYAYTIHSELGDHAVAARVNGLQVPLRSELKNGDVVEVITAADATPNPTWLGFVRTGRARSSIRHHLKLIAQAESVALGEKLLTQALRAEGIDKLPATEPPYDGVWAQILQATGNRTAEELLADIGHGKRIASLVAQRMTALLAEMGTRPDQVLMSVERFAAGDRAAQDAVLLDGSESASVKYAACCRPVPGDAIVGYLGRGEGLVVHVESCGVARKLQSHDGERFITVAWADEPARSFDAGLLVVVTQGRGVLARVTAALTAAEVDIVHLSMTEESFPDAVELKIVVGVRNLAHLELVLRHLQRTPAVLRATRIVAQ